MDISTPMRYDVKKLIKARILRGWTQADLARRIGRTQSVISVIENEGTASAPTMKAIADELGLAMDDLILEEELTK